MKPDFGYYRSCEDYVNGLKDWYKAAGNPKILLEIGSATGDSIEIFHECNNDIVIVSIDPWDWANPMFNLSKEETYEFFLNRTKDWNVIPIKEHSHNIVNLFPDNFFDAIYIDADHSYYSVKKDIEMSLPKTKGWLGGHDYSEKYGTVRAVHETTNNVQVFSDTSWLIHKDNL